MGARGSAGVLVREQGQIMAGAAAGEEGQCRGLRRPVMLGVRQG